MGASVEGKEGGGLVLLLVMKVHEYTLRHNENSIADTILYRMYASGVDVDYE